MLSVFNSAVSTQFLSFTFHLQGSFFYFLQKKKKEEKRKDKLTLERKFKLASLIALLNYLIPSIAYIIPNIQFISY